MLPPVVRRRLAASAALAAFTLTGLTACGGEDSSSSADPAESTTPAAPTTSATTAETPPESTLPPGTQPPETTGSADTAGGESLTADEFAEIYKTAIDQATTADITLTTSGTTALKGTGQIDFSQSPPEISATLTAASLGGDADVRLVDGTFYLQLPQLGPKFLKFDAADPSNPFGSLFSSSLDPSSLVEVLRQGITEATSLGEEDITGEMLAHYAVTVDSEAILAQYPAELRKTAAKQLPPTVDYDMYFDEDGLLRRTMFDLGQAGVTTQTYDDWGTDVDIEAPAPGQVQALPKA